MCDARRITPGALDAFLDALEAQPHVLTDPPSDARLRACEDRVILDTFHEAGQAMRNKYVEAFRATPHERARGMNFSFLDYKETDPTLNACAMCCVEPSQCLDPANHFGSRGESPPDTECPRCGKNFWNNYDSPYKLKLHRAAKDECDERERAIHERLKTKEPEPLKTSWGSSKKTTWTSTPRSSKKPKKK